MPWTNSAKKELKTGIHSHGNFRDQMKLFSGMAFSREMTVARNEVEPVVLVHCELRMPSSFTTTA